MKNQKAVFNTLCILLYLFLAGNSYGASVFGPQDFIIEDGNKHSSSHGFYAEPSAPSKITITKFSGNEDYTRGRIRLNGKIYRLQNFLRGDDIVFERSIQLQENNRLKIVFKGAPGAALAVEISQELPPTASLQSLPSTIIRGESSELSWTSENADECFLEPGFGYVDCNGSIKVTPPGTTEYTFTALNSVLGEQATASSTIGVRIVIPSATLVATPDHVQLGKSSTLSWTSTEANSCSISPDIGVVECNGSLEVTPQDSTNYIFTAKNTTSGTMAAALAAIEVMVLAPVASLSATPAEIILGESSTLSWTSASADDCSISPDIGNVDCHGTMEVTPQVTTHYIFTARNSNLGRGMSAIATISVSGTHSNNTTGTSF